MPTAVNTDTIGGEDASGKSGAATSPNNVSEGIGYPNTASFGAGGASTGGSNDDGNITMGQYHRDQSPAIASSKMISRKVSLSPTNDNDMTGATTNKTATATMTTGTLGQEVQG